MNAVSQPTHHREEGITQTFPPSWLADKQREHQQQIVARDVPKTEDAIIGYII